jgi:hypothetical protein
MGSERGQSTVEWVGTLLVVALLLVSLVGAGVRVPGDALAREIASRILCAASLSDGCGDEPALIADYGTEVGKLARKHMPTLAFEQGSGAVPIDFRRCRETSCGDGSTTGLEHRTDAGLAVSAFVHVIDCRATASVAAGADGYDCSGKRAGNLYIQYWTYYADSATLRGVPIVGDEGFHVDDWEGVQIRIKPDGSVDERASSHDGYNYAKSPGDWGSDAGIDPLKDVAEFLGARNENGWGPETHLLLVSGGSHAGNAVGLPSIDHFTPGRRVHLIPMEPIAGTSRERFAISPPWQKKVWCDPEYEGTD